MIKKIFFVSFFIISFSLVSCASKPKVAAVDENVKEAADETNETSSETSNLIPEDYSDLEEPVTPEQTDLLPELPVEQVAEEKTAIIEEESIKEPEVKDEPLHAVEKETGDSKENTESSGMFGSEKAEATTETLASDTKNEAQEEIPSSSEKENKEVEEISDASEDTATPEEKSEPGKVEVMPNPSRSITIQKNQLIDIIYPGKGWIYQGNIDEEGNIDSRNRNFVFGGRKLGGNDTAFTLRSRNPGTFILHFYKNDTLTGNYIDDYLEVIVQNKAANSTEHVLAPNYAEIVPPKASITAEKIKEEKKQKQLAEEMAKQTALEEKKLAEKKTAPSAKTAPVSSTNKDSSIDTIIQTSESAPKNDSPVVKTNKPAAEKTAPQEKISSPKQTETVSEENLDLQNAEQLLSTAKKHYDSKEYPKAYSAISKFFDKASSRLDEGLYLRGQILEEKSPVQNIKNAIESYDLVVKNYPASPLWDKANKRSIFLKRFYINIR